MSELSVLIAEPSKTGRHIFAQLMSRMGVSVTFTTSARETYLEAGKKRFHLICLSQKLPDDEGVNVCAKLRKMDQYRSTTVLLVTPQKSSVNYDYAFSNGVTQLIGRHELHRFAHAVSLMVERTKPIKGKVLVVEDSRSQAEYISALLASMGLEVQGVCSGEHAIKELSVNRYNLAVIDVVLAGSMTGVELVDYVRTLPEPYNHVRVLAMSAYEDPSRRIKLFNLGVDDFINKPIVREELIARVRGLLSQHYIAATVEENERLNRSLSQLLDNSPDMIGRFDMEGKLLFMNPRMEAELGVRANDEVGKHYTQLGLNSETQLIYQNAIAQMESTKQVVRYQTSGKNNVDFDLQFSPEVVSEEIVSFICSARDITQLTRLQKQLMASKEAVEQASQAKTRFLATMSHELRTPLNAISGFSQLMRQKLKSEQQIDQVEFDEYLGLIGENSHNLTALIDDVLDLSQIEAGKLSSHLQSVKLHKFIDGIKSGFASDCAKREVNLEVAIEPAEEIEVVIDKVKTLTMLNNLIDNAIKYSFDGGTVHVNVYGSVNQLRVEVIDKGIGIPDDFKDKLYSPFEQVDNSRTRDYGGTGLGLSIVHKFALFLGGSIDIKSKEGQGTLCILQLPIHPPTEQGVEQLQAPIEAQPVADVCFGGQRILVVEDSVVNQQLMRACLSNYGLTVEIAENGIEGIEKTQSWRPDLVLMDMHMPKMDGLEATTQIRAIEELKDIPVFGLSADVHKEYIQKAYDCGINEYLTKPVDFNQLCQLLTQYLSRIEAAPQPAVSVENEAKEPLMSESSVLNAEKGISFAANNESLFKQLLSTFVKQYNLSGEQINQLYVEGQYDDAMKLAHTMKGVCSTLGMDSLSEVAKTMQFAFANEQLSQMDELISRYQGLLTQAIAEASAYCEG